MKNLVFAALLMGGLSQATGCIIVSDDDDDESTFSYSWNLQEFSSGAAVDVSCADAGVASIAANSQPIGSTAVIDLFDCVDLTHETNPLPLTDYLVWIEALDGNENRVALSNSSEETLFDGNPVGVTFDVPVDVGAFEFGWTLSQAGASVTCADIVDGGPVEIISTLVGTTDAETDEFPCADAQGVTAALPLGDYVLSIGLLNVDKLLIGEPVNLQGSLTYGNEVVDLGDVVLPGTM